MSTLEQWYVSLDAEELMARTADPELRKLRIKRLQKAVAHTSAEVDYPKLVEHVGGRPTIRDDPPLVFHSHENETPEFERNVHAALKRYRASLQEDRRYLFDRYRLADIAAKVVGIGSVGTVCAVGLFLAYDDDPLFLQIKQARTSVLAPYVRSGGYANEGQRVVVGQRLMQAASDVFLGWTQGDKGRHFYVRQLRDVKLKPMVEIFNAQNLERFATCVRLGAGQGSRALGLCFSHRGLSRQQSGLRRGDSALRTGLRGPERARPRRAGESGARRARRGGARPLRSASGSLLAVEPCPHGVQCVNSGPLATTDRIALRKRDARHGLGAAPGARQ